MSLLGIRGVPEGYRGIRQSIVAGGVAHCDCCGEHTTPGRMNFEGIEKRFILCALCLARAIDPATQPEILQVLLGG